MLHLGRNLILLEFLLAGHSKKGCDTLSLPPSLKISIPLHFLFMRLSLVRIEFYKKSRQLGLPYL
jgi:hypothetical protein